MSRIKKLFNKKKPQLRRCAFCNKPGHNKSTCAKFLSSITKKTVPTITPTNAPIRFFVHHVSYQPTTSPHVVNLKKDSLPAWHSVETVAPEKNQTLDFNAAYEKIKQEIQSSKAISPKDINQNIFATLEKTTKTNGPDKETIT